MHPSLSGLWDWLDTENQSFDCRPHLANLVASSTKALLYGIPFFIAFVFIVPLRIILKTVDYFEFASMDGVDIVLVRHGQAVSNVNSGEWRPDGLTDFGIKSIHEFTRHTKLRNVHAIVSSCSARSIQTAQILADAFTDPPKIHCRPEFQELTPWPYDQPINFQQSEGRPYTYTKLRGGSEEDAGTLTRDQVVNMNNLDWPVMPHTLDLFPNRDELENRVIEARRWLLRLAKEVDHLGSNIHGRRTIVVVASPSRMAARHIDR
ncbi:uncharacterized protein PG998_000774 [Apiospora kogelbergensis]|uniref:uncharacterized protein n=1 Tax=Apiospora kogelbergensis TaxID=1337665 RepID=UPI003130E190